MELEPRHDQPGSDAAKPAVKAAPAVVMPPPEEDPLEPVYCYCQQVRAQQGPAFTGRRLCTWELQQAICCCQTAAHGQAPLRLRAAARPSLHKLFTDAVVPVQVSFGEMIACDNPDCAIEWFHFECVGLDPNQSRPRGKKWYCNDCAAAMRPGRRR